MSSTARPKLLTAPWVVDETGRTFAGAGVLVQRGKIARLCASPGSVRRAARDAAIHAFDEGTLTPGLVNAHAHLELTGIAERLGRAKGFRGWVDRLIALRVKEPRAALLRAVRQGADRLLVTGTTTVGDIASGVEAEEVLARHPLRAVLYREVLDAGDPARTEAALARVKRALPRRVGCVEGLSPHSPYSVSPGLFRALGEIAERRALPVSVHWSETEAELEFMKRGSGALAGLVQGKPQTSGLERIERAGLLNPRASLVHGNFPMRGEAQRIARAGATLVHCPGSHAWFGRAPFPLEHYRSRGVALALGTDSMASNEDLDMRREMALLRSSMSAAGPELVWTLATKGGACALGLGSETGRLRAGFRADLCLFHTGARKASELLDELTAGLPPVMAVWIGGRRVQ